MLPFGLVIKSIIFFTELCSHTNDPFSWPCCSSHGRIICFVGWSHRKYTSYLVCRKSQHSSKVSKCLCNRYVLVNGNALRKEKLLNVLPPILLRGNTMGWTRTLSPFLQSCRIFHIFMQLVHIMVADDLVPRCSYLFCVWPAQYFLYYHTTRLKNVGILI